MLRLARANAICSNSAKDVNLWTSGMHAPLEKGSRMRFLLGAAN